MGKKRSKSNVEDFKRSEILLNAHVDAVEEYFFSLTGIEDREFAPKFKNEIRATIKRCGVTFVLEAVQDAVLGYGENALEKIIPIAICRANPKTKVNYIIGIIKNKLGIDNIEQSWTAEIKNVVSDIVDRDNGEREAIDYVIEQFKRRDPASMVEYITYLRYYGRLYFENWHNSLDNFTQIWDDVEKLTKVHVQQPPQPPKMIRDILLALTPEQAETYKMLEEEGVLRLSAAGECVTIPHVFELILRLRQICNFDPVTGESAKMESIYFYVEEVVRSGRKAIIFSQWVETLYRLKDVLKPFGITEYHGKVPKKKRDEMLHRFHEDQNVHIMLMSYKSGNVKLDLRFVEYVFLFDQPLNSSVADQAVDQIYGIGRTSPLSVMRYISENTIEEKIHLRQTK